VIKLIWPVIRRSVEEVPRIARYIMFPLLSHRRSFHTDVDSDGHKWQVLQDAWYRPEGLEVNTASLSPPCVLLILWPRWINFTSFTHINHLNIYLFQAQMCTILQVVRSEDTWCEHKYVLLETLTVKQSSNMQHIIIDNNPLKPNGYFMYHQVNGLPSYSHATDHWYISVRLRHSCVGWSSRE
jgi:hypothetical protein